MGLLAGICIYMAAMSVAAFALYGWDKAQARKGAWRVPERRLLLLAIIGGAPGAFVGMRAFHHKTRKPLFKWVVTPLALLQALLFAALIYLTVFAAHAYRATPEARACLESTSEVAVAEVDAGYRFDGPGVRDVLVFYPGANVEAQAYAPLMAEVARAGVDCVLLRVPLNLALLDANRADVVLQEGDYERVYVGGHSLGGVVASRYAARHEGELAGLVLLAAYATDDLSKSELDVLCVLGTCDEVLNRANYEKNRSKLPKDTHELVIEGANHAGFGSYGTQAGDGVATIAAEEQRLETAQAIAALALGGVFQPLMACV